MTFNKQVKEAKIKQLQSRILRDIVFIILGIIFLSVSIFMAYKDSKKVNNNSNKKVTPTTVKISDKN